MSTPDWQDYAWLWDRVGLDRPTVMQIEKEMHRMLLDEELTARLNKAFERMVARYLLSIQK